MKAVKIILGILVLVTALFLGIGLIVPSVNYGDQITVDKSIEEA